MSVEHDKIYSVAERYVDAAQRDPRSHDSRIKSGLLDVAAAHLQRTSKKFWDRAYLVSFLNARGETRAMHTKQTSSSKFNVHGSVRRNNILVYNSN